MCLEDDDQCELFVELSVTLSKKSLVDFQSNLGPETSYH